MLKYITNPGRLSPEIPTTLYEITPTKGDIEKLALYVVLCKRLLSIQRYSLSYAYCSNRQNCAITSYNSI